MTLRVVRPLVGLGAVLLAVAAIAQCRSESATRAAHEARWATSGAGEREPGAAASARRDPDAQQSPLVLARALFAAAYDLRGLAALPREEAAAGARLAQERLVTVAALASATLRQRPTAWQAAMLLGGARLLQGMRTPGDEPYRQPQRWRAPLAQAMALAPAEPAPRLLLDTGYLATWQALSAPERATARELLRASFTDRSTLDQLLPVWAAVARDEAELESVLPREPHPYELLQEVRARAHDWSGVCAARARWRPLLLADLERQLTAAEQRLAGGDSAGGRQALLEVVAQAEPDQRTAPLLVRAIGELPPGPISPSQEHGLERWLDWALPLFALGRQPLPESVMARLAGLSPDLPPEKVALAELAAGELDRAESYERRTQRLWSEEWAPYAVAKAEVLLERGDVDDAAEALGATHRIYQTSWPYLHARERLAMARHERGQTAPASALETASWPPTAWLYTGSEATLELVAARAAPGLLLTIDVAPAEGGVAEGALDGQRLACAPVEGGATLRLPVEIAAGAHLLRLRPLSPGRIAPGRVELLPPR